MKALILTGPGDGPPYLAIILPPKGLPNTLTKGEVATLQITAEAEFNQRLIEVEVDVARDYNHAERILRRRSNANVVPA